MNILSKITGSHSQEDENFLFAIKNILGFKPRNIDLYKKALPEKILSLKTYYEVKFLEEGKKITYLSFKLPVNRKVIEPEVNNEG